MESGGHEKKAVLGGLCVGMCTEKHECTWQLGRAGDVHEWEAGAGTRWPGRAASPRVPGPG